MHIQDVLERLGKDRDDKKAKNSLVSSLNVYSNEGRFFTRVAPSKYGIFGRDMPEAEPSLDTEEEEPDDSEEELTF